MTPAASPPRPLPIRPRPITGESPASYVRRLARANHLRPAYLRRYLSQTGHPDTIRLDWLAILAGRSQPALERALTGQDTSRPQARQAERPRLFAAIRRDARDNELSIRALADRHGVHRRTVRQALASPWPARRKELRRSSRLDPFKNIIGEMLTPPPAGRTTSPTARQIHARLENEHGMTGVSYSTVSNYVASRRLARQPAGTHSTASHDAKQAITYLKETLETMQPGVVTRLQPHFDALESVIKQAPDSAETEAHDTSRNRPVSNGSSTHD